MKNLNLLFNKLYYEKLGTAEFDRSVQGYNREILTAVFRREQDYQKSEAASACFALKTSYPGLLVGTGNLHGSHMSDDDINMGFSFDYTTGQPFIPGSSVKGVLRSYFRQYPEVVAELSGVEDVKALEEEIFENNDIFFDAVVCKGARGGKLMGEDFITYHESEIKNPVPVRMLKILPGVCFEFRFCLTDGKILKEKKQELFCELLKLFGIGAKTNTGYGFLEDVSEEELNRPEKIAEEAPQRPQNRPNGGNRPHQSGGKPSSDRIKCPHCGASNYRFYPDGNERKKCYSCKEFLKSR